MVLRHHRNAAVSRPSRPAGRVSMGGCGEEGLVLRRIWDILHGRPTLLRRTRQKEIRFICRIRGGSAGRHCAHRRKLPDADVRGGRRILWVRREIPLRRDIEICKWRRDIAGGGRAAITHTFRARPGMGPVSRGESRDIARFGELKKPSY